ncbi:MAG: hypothetical protein EPN84_03650 [Legionella sp.]|nr:MAG: hypothetical protein EPN84_03650 [Legionella sp.]
MKTDLKQLLSYKNYQVLAYFCHHHPDYSLEEGQQLFEDFLAWIWLNLQRSQQGKKTLLFGPLLVLDELWHAFILHTRDYHDFCLDYLGAYFHHDIEPIGFEHHLQEDELSDFLEDCFLYLDEAWVNRRFAGALVD